MPQPDAGVDPLFISFQQALAGRYSIDRELGRGGMGVVYLAREVHLDRPVAIKLLPPDRMTLPGLRERFLREARLAAKLSHPNIIPIHAVEDTGGFVFYVMAYVDGETLAQRVRARGPLTGSEGARVLREVAWALAYAHGQGLVHRDVKPDNILLEAGGRVLVADFGIAAAAGESGVDGVTGTPEFMSPEQALAKPVDARSDLYGLGATAFFALSGRFPFEGRTPTEILARQVTEPAPPLASLGVAVPRKLAALVDRCLAKDPGHRPASAQALADELGVALEQRRELPAALRNFVKRNARLNGAGTLVGGLGLLVGASITARMGGGLAGFAALIAGATLAPFGYVVLTARRLMLRGFRHQDLGPAFTAEIEQSQEELTVGRRRGPSMVEPFLGFVAMTSGSVFGGSLPALVVAALFVPDLIGPASMLMAFSGATSASTALLLVTLRQRHRDVDTEFWARVWLGKIGKLAFGVAKRLLGKRGAPVAMTHRATELALGLAAEQLYESLPSASRQALHDLPAVLRRLQDDAQDLRKRYDEIQSALADAGDAATTPAYADVRAVRDEIHARLADAVAALETMRLNLLRLHAGAASVEGVTTHLELAADVSSQVARLVAAHEEVERALRFPRLAASTPV
ncbi:MAG TPA: serine/threonine-protein kinase [Gemmatimonadales bacterium]|nr:serine/threonine-protein kinase [Gemmatimonadales bacterium]